MPFWSRKKTPVPLTQSREAALRATRHSRSVDIGSSDRLACVIALLQDQPEWDYALDQEAAREAAHYGAAFIGFHEPYDAEEKAIFDFLISHFAGRKISTFAWGLYADQLQAE